MCLHVLNSRDMMAVEAVWKHSVKVEYDVIEEGT